MARDAPANAAVTRPSQNIEVAENIINNIDVINNVQSDTLVKPAVLP